MHSFDSLHLTLAPQILSMLGSAAFSDAVECFDIVSERYVCVKIIKRHKDFFMGLDEIKLLRFLNSHDPLDDRNVVQLLDYFFYKEHIFLVSELLKENLYDCAKRMRQAREPTYFTLPRVQRIAHQVLVCECVGVWVSVVLHSTEVCGPCFRIV